MASGWNLWLWLVSVVVRRYIIGVRSEPPPLSVELSEFSLYLYIIYIYIFQAVRLCTCR